MSSTLTFEQLQTAVSGNAAAIRLITRLQPAGGPGSKVFPPTHSGGVYAWEMRRIGNEEVQTVLLDSVQSQANRMEQALLEAHRAERLSFPLLQVDFSNAVPEIGVITTLDAPHRIADAIFRDSQLNGTNFRESTIGRAFETANIRNATALLQYCPTALLFGVWDSTGSRGGLGNKFQRAVTSEIVGIHAVKGVHTSSRIDPLGITKAGDFFKAAGGDWTLEENQAERNQKGEPVKAKPSDFVHGNIPPDFSRYNPKQNRMPLRTASGEIRVGDVLSGGVTMDCAVQTTVLSLPALRRLRFPVAGQEPAESNNSARTLLAAFALAAVTHLREHGYDLRSRCLLIPEGDAEFELVSNNGKAEIISLDAGAADNLFREAVQQAKNTNLPWLTEVINLTPQPRLVDLVRRSREVRDTEEE